jgi:hypothetical protein
VVGRADAGGDVQPLQPLQAVLDDAVFRADDADGNERQARLGRQIGRAGLAGQQRLGRAARALRGHGQHLALLQPLQHGAQRGKVGVEAVDPDAVHLAGHVAPEGVLLVLLGQDEDDVVAVGQQDDQERLQTADVVTGDDEAAGLIVDIADDLDPGDDAQDKPREIARTMRRKVCLLIW